jgi:glyoxylase-like metal-dependent hydrolase (beta-lactamase superfamily II)
VTALAQRPIRRLLIPLLLVLIAVLGWQAWQSGRIERPGPNQPFIATTPWGQRVVPTIDTLAEIAVWNSLKPGQPWSAGLPAGEQVRRDYVAGKFRLDRTPWTIAPGVWAIGPWNTEQNIYLFDTGEGLLLVDPSLDVYQDEVLAQIKGLGFRPEQVKWVVLSHCHIDHGQSCRTWQQRGAKVIVGAGDAPELAQCSDVVAAWFVPEARNRCTPCTADIKVSGGQVLRFGNLTLHAIDSSGHTPGSTSFAFERGGKWHLLSGDIVLHNGRHAWMGGKKADWGHYVTALGRLARFSVDGKPVKFDLLLPGHGAIELDKGQRSVELTERAVKSLVARRAAGEKVERLYAYPWAWENLTVKP